MEGINPCPDAYDKSVVVQKLQEGARDAFVFDKNFTIQRFAHPVANPPESEMAAGWRIRRRTKKYPTIFSSAQTLELTISSDLYEQSVAYGYNRPRPNIRLPDGTYTNRPEDVKGWEYHLNPDAFIGFMTGVYPRKNGGYMRDVEFETALGGSMWRPQLFQYLDNVFPDQSYQEHLTSVDRGDPDADVQAPEFRVELIHKGEGGDLNRERFLLTLLKAQFEGEFTNNVTFIDESNPLTKEYRTYLVPKYGTKDLSLERFGSQAAVHAGVPMEEIKIHVFGDAPPDLESGLRAFSGAKGVRLTIAAKSRISEAVLNNADFGGMPLPGCPNHPTLPGRFLKTQTPGVLEWHAKSGGRPREVVLAEYAPWSAGLECTESVDACLDHYGFKD